MSVHDELTVPYHQQDEWAWCGAACAQMVLSSLGAPLFDQGLIYNKNHCHSIIDNYPDDSRWFTGPDGLEWTMRDLDPGRHQFKLFALCTEDELSRRIAWTIHECQVAPIVLIRHSTLVSPSHWIVVRGYTATAPPAQAADPSFSIESFDLSDPFPPVPCFYTHTGTPPPHAAGDGCGLGIDTSNLPRGCAEQNISYTTWKSDYMGCVADGFWTGKYISVASDGPGPPPISGLHVIDPESPEQPMAASRTLKRRFARRDLLTPAVAKERAYQGLKSYGLTERKNYANALRHARAATPLLVQRLDRLDSFYYLVPMEEKSGLVPLVVSVDGYTGQYLQSAVRSTRSGGIFSLIDRKAAWARVVGQRIELPNNLGRLSVREEAVCFYQHLVWKPCQESLSPLYPFYQFTLGEHRIHVRSDGFVFTRLHDDVRGI